MYQVALRQAKLAVGLPALLPGGRIASATLAKLRWRRDMTIAAWP